MYSIQKEFKDFIKDSRDYGVSIVPEIDTPAHSLALTKVRPDLRHGTNGRENDHLALRDKYDESLGFVQSIFDEFMKTSDPVLMNKQQYMLAQMNTMQIKKLIVDSLMIS
ncbi:MAG: family 20 glycosylhydrolase [Faecalibacillus faecis]